MKEIAMILKFIVIGLIYLVIFRIIKIMYLDLKGINRIKAHKKEFALEINDAPEDIGITKGSLYIIHKVMSIGRNFDNDLVIKDPYVSGNHAKIFVKDDRLFIEDLGSTNGTYVNGRRIDMIEQIEEGDIIDIGRISLKVLE